MEINGKKIDDAKVAAARRDFERNRASHGSKGRLTFDELLQRFALDCNSFTSIAEAHGVRYQRLHGIYNRYFRELFPGERTGRKRQRICALKRSKVLELDFSNGVLEPWAQAIIAAAQGCGLSVRRCKSGNPRLARSASVKSFKKMEILINNKHCKLHLVTTMSQTSPRLKRSYGSCRLRGFTKCEFVIVQQEIAGGRIFVIPTKDLQKRYGERWEITIYLPVDRELATHRDAMDWWQYENAWDFLKA